MRYLLLSLLTLLSACSTHQQQVKSTSANPEQDPFIWLEEVEGEKALTWVKEKNKKSLAQITNHPEFNALFETNKEIYNSNERIPYVRQMGDYLYNFWRDETHVRGIYRRTTFAEYQKDQPAWETVLDFDLLAENENENWVYKGMNCRYPAYDRCLVSLSRGGADAVVIREYNLNEQQFVEQGFFLPEAKTGVSWVDENTLLVGTDFGDNSVTESGYPRIAKEWKRGESLSQAQTLFTSPVTDVALWPGVYYDDLTPYKVLVQSTTFYTQNYLLLDDSNQITRLNLPQDASLSAIKNGQMLVELKSDWQPADRTYLQGSLLSIPVEQMLNGGTNYQVVVEPQKNTALQGLSTSKDYIYISMLEDVVSTLYQAKWNGENWQKQAIELPGVGSASISGSSLSNNQIFVNFNSHLKPATLYAYNADSHNQLKPLKQLPAFFDADKYNAQQHFATAKDGTRIPYFLISAKQTIMDGNNPTLLYGYGGFEIALRPSYSATVGTNWLDNGGTYVVANIRGGGEYGPAWHQAALKENRHIAFTDFIAVAEDLIARKITSPEHLGIRGGSNGGLLVGTVFTMRPDLFNAVVCSVPLLDMQRFHKLLAGASWVAEYGNPDIPEEWEYIKTYSPYHNLSSQKDYPKVLFTTSTRDDRVHPAHARKMVAKMESLGHDVLYYENMEGGHGGAANNNQSAYLNALVYSYLLERLK